MSFSSEVKNELSSIAKTQSDHCAQTEALAYNIYSSVQPPSGVFAPLARVERQCCKRAYIRGAFLAVGSLNAPEKHYHLEFICPDKPCATALKHVIACFGISAKITERKSHYIVYLKEGENIVDLLNIMGAHRSLMKFENARILKDMRNNVNRAVNCETYNLTKTAQSAAKQINDINAIANARGLGCLSEQLQEVARLRLLHNEASLKEIGEMLSPPVGKSGVNHRLRKISEIAQNLRGGYTP